MIGRTKSRTLQIAGTALILALAGCKPKEMPVAVGQTIRVTVQTPTLPAAIRDQKERVQSWNEMRSFYEKRQFQPAWFTPTGAKPQAEELVAAIDHLAKEGLDTQRYGKADLQALVKEVGENPGLDDVNGQRRLAEADMRLTYTYLTMAAHLASGRLQPETLHVDWYTKPRRLDLDTRLAQALEKKGAIQEALDGYAPPGEDYVRLRAALSRYRDLAAHGGWPAVGQTIKAGASGEPVRRLRERLAAEGFVPAPAPGTSQPPAPGAWDESLANTVKLFQQRHGLQPTGAVDAGTLAELDVPVADRVRQIQVNLERWRWLPNSFGERYIKVNIPEFEMQLVDGGKPALAMRVVVGKAQQNRTPVFSDKMTYLELNPEWNLPNDIVNEEIKPALAKDPGYLERKGLEVVSTDDGSFRLRQGPGPDNPLGQVKFMFPNQFDIYLHDTPADHLFAKAERDFSHGCIRLERPLDLAAYLLKDDPKWTPETIREAIATGERQTVSIPRPLPVHILYFTAWTNPDGTIEFRRDVYGADAKLEAALDKEPAVKLDFGAVRGQVKAGMPQGSPAGQPAVHPTSS
jgi:murein L,D-transpeptidase YcbB/YkuD